MEDELRSEYDLKSLRVRKAGPERKNNEEDTMRVEYPEELIKSGVRGKYAKRYAEGTNIALIDPDLHQLFPDSESVNRALREYAEIIKSTKE